MKSARVIHTSEAPHAVDTIQTSAGARLVSKEKRYRKDSTQWDENYQAQGSLSNLFANSGITNFFIRGSNITFVEKMFIKVTLQNNGASAVTMVPAPLFFNQVQLAPNGSDILSPMYPENLWLSLGDIAAEQTSALASMQNWGALSYSSSSTTIAAGDTATYYIDINTPFNCTDIPLNLCSPPQIRLYWSNTPIANNSAMTTVSSVQVTDCQLFVVGEKLGDEPMRQLTAQVKSGIHAYTAYVPVRQIIAGSSSSVAAGSMINQTLTSMDGHYSDINFLVRGPNATKEEIIAFSYGTTGGTGAYGPSSFACDNQTLFDASGGPVGISNMDGKFVTGAIASQYYDSYWWVINSSTYPYLFSEDPVLAHRDGIRQDAKVVNSWRYQFSPRATLANGYDLVVLANQLCLFELHPNGSLTYRML